MISKEQRGKRERDVGIIHSRYLPLEGEPCKGQVSNPCKDS